GRLRPFEQALEFSTTMNGRQAAAMMNDGRVLDALATELGVALNTGDVNAVRLELGALPATSVPRRPAPTVAPVAKPSLAANQAILSTWHHLLDNGSLLDGDEVLMGTARRPVARLSKATALGLGVGDGDPVTVSTDRGSITLPAHITEMPADLVWLPTNSPESAVRRTLGATSGAVVTLSTPGGAA
ncbi:MAG TPA: molybdopterin dinucleotide binding domain-containing protein, partial [Candidatus Limnocylindria bacterium]|nr:molybdopterin dinucleotide binding domain-containing protein [Candidatus Limnocylindria bacterium]